LNPAAAGARHVGAIAVLQRQDDAAAFVVINQHGTCPSKTRRPRQAFGAVRAASEIQKRECRSDRNEGRQ